MKRLDESINKFLNIQNKLIFAVASVQIVSNLSFRVRKISALKIERLYKHRLTNQCFIDAWRSFDEIKLIKIGG